MKTRYFCTYFDHNYLPRAMVMLESLYEHNPHALVYVLCLNDQCYEAMQKLAYPFVRLISMHDFEAANPDLVAVRPTRSLVEYYFTITPCLPWYILHKEDGIDAITYLDADMMFFSSVEPIFEEAGDASVILTPHNFAPHLMDRVKYGVYNVSWMTFYATQQGMECLAWYKNACLEWCYDRYEKKGDVERFADQKYLDYFSRNFAGVWELLHTGAGVAPWNISRYEIYLHDEHVMVGKQPLIFYHAQQFLQLYKCFYASGLLNYDIQISSAMKKNILRPYCEKYSKSLEKYKLLFNSIEKILPRMYVSSGIFNLIRSVKYEFKKKSLIVHINF